MEKETTERKNLEAAITSQLEATNNELEHKNDVVRNLVSTFRLLGYEI